MFKHFEKAFSQVRSRDALALVIIAIVLVGIFTADGVERAPISSAETRFVEYSESGIQIVPASCESTPHDGDNCYSYGQGYYYGYGQGGYSGGYSYGYGQGYYANYSYSQGYYQGSYCSAQYYCQGNDLYYRDNQCQNQFIQECAFGCSGGGCLPPSPASGDITANPRLVDSGSTSEITWTSQNAVSCTVTEDSGEIEDSWTGLNGTRTSSSLVEQTKYTLLCQSRVGATPASFTDSVTITIVPIEEEQ